MVAGGFETARVPCLPSAPASTIVCRAKRAFGEHGDTGREWVNISEIAGRFTDRIRVGRPSLGDAVDAVFEAIEKALAKGEDVEMLRFGTFGTRKRPARTGRNPRTGEIQNISESTHATFKAGKPSMDAVNADGS